MLEILKNYLSANDYYIIILEDGLLIKNCTKILNIEDDFINFICQDKSVLVRGKNFKLISNINSDIKIQGTIESVKVI